MFGNRMKEYEGIEADRKFIPTLPIIVRLDGRCFSRLTKDLDRPYDSNMSELMTNVTINLVKETEAIIGYTQSDEISLILYSDSIEHPVYFNGRISKIISVISSVATYWFNELKHDKDFPDSFFELPGLFDCRAWTVPNRTEAVNAVLWREMDATKNSVSAAARVYYTHRELHGVKREGLMDMLMAKGINWNDYPAYFKRGTYIQKRATPVDRAVPGLTVSDQSIATRGVVNTLPMPPLTTVVNRTGVFFEKQEPVVDSF